ncbi:unannotated protein [freshwater metagenome]|uniref:Unannotated protein n=1 Tax=freshwater metagenome TaxID=449393 RepID=A0A6J7N5M4_9ZZZZ
MRSLIALIFDLGLGRLLLLKIATYLQQKFPSRLSKLGCEQVIVKVGHVENLRQAPLDI